MAAKKDTVEYRIGDTVVYPLHGAARVIDICERDFKGVQRQYITLEIVAADNLKVQLPVENFKKVGIRSVVDKDIVKGVFEVLRTPIVEEEKTNWSRRYKLNVEKIGSGNVNKIAEVVRDLSQRDNEDYGLSAGEKRMLSRAREVLSSEIALSGHLTPEEAQHLLDVNLGLVEPTEEDLKHHSHSPQEAVYETLNRVARKGSKK